MQEVQVKLGQGVSLEFHFRFILRVKRAVRVAKRNPPTGHLEWRITPSALALRTAADRSANPVYACCASACALITMNKTEQSTPPRPATAELLLLPIRSCLLGRPRRRRDLVDRPQSSPICAIPALALTRALQACAFPPNHGSCHSLHPTHRLCESQLRRGQVQSHQRNFLAQLGRIGCTLG